MNTGTGEEECAAFADGAFCPDAAAVFPHNCPADRQPEPRPAHGARIGRIHLLEALKDQIQFLRRDAAAMVFYFEDDLVIVQHLRAQADLAVAR